MRDELPPQEIFDSLSELYGLIGQYSAKLPRGCTDYQLTLVALASKAITHTREAFRVFAEHAAIGETTILLRSAYEATVVFLYLKLNPQQFCKYKAYSEIVELRNQMETLEIAGDQLEEAGRIEQLEHNHRQRNKVLTNNSHTYFKLSEADLNNLTALKRKTNKAHFMNFGEMQNGLLEDPFASGLVKTAFQVYNLGSQMAHSHYNMTVLTYVHDRSHPIYNVYDITRQIASLFSWNALGMDQIGCMKPGLPQALQRVFMRTLKQIRHSRGDTTPLE